MQPDYDAYLPYLERFDLSDAQKRDVIDTIHAAMQAFVDKAFGTHPVQLRLVEERSFASASPATLDSVEGVRRAFQQQNTITGNQKE
jgi:hypothetical protein